MLVHGQEKGADEFVDLGLHFEFKQGDAAILASSPNDVIEVANAFENRPEIVEMIDTVLMNLDNDAVVQEVKAAINAKMSKYPLYASGTLAQ